MSKELLIQDGVKYRLWIPENEPADFEPMIKTHVKDIFGDECMYFPKQKLKTLANNSSIPDGFVIDFKNAKWYIVELKLLSEDAVNRISRQIVSYRSSMKNFENRQQIFKLVNAEIGKPEMHKELYDIVVENKPEIIVVINSLQGELGKQFNEQVEEVDPNVKIVEFKTFKKEGNELESNHLHLFEPLYPSKLNPVIPNNGKIENSMAPKVTKFETKFTSADVHHMRCVRLSRKYRSLFPSDNVDFIVETNQGEINTCIIGAGPKENRRKGIDNAGSWFSRGLRGWFKKNSIQVGDRASIEVLEPKKRYKLEVIK